MAGAMPKTCLAGWGGVLGYLEAELGAEVLVCASHVCVERRWAHVAYGQQACELRDEHTYAVPVGVCLHAGVMCLCVVVSAHVCVCTSLLGVYM